MQSRVGAGGLALSPCSCLPRLHTGLTPLSFHCCWFGTNPSNFLLRQDKMCALYLFIYSTSHIPLFTFFFFFFSSCLQMRVCKEQIRHTQPRTEGTKSTRNLKKKKEWREEEILLKETTRRTTFVRDALSYIRSKYGAAHSSPSAPKVSEQDVKSERLSRLLGEEARAVRWSGEVSVVLLSSVSTEPHRPSKANTSPE